jgi:hypothetical protein
MAQNVWAVICPENAAPGLWRTWLKEGCVAIGWPPSHHHLRGSTTKSGWRKARERASKVRRGDIVIPYLLPNRFGVPGKVLRVAIRDDEWKPTVPKGGYANNPTEPELGRRINVKWLSQGVPGANQVAVVPKNMRTAGGEVKQTIEFVRPKRRQRFMNIISNPANWRVYGPLHGGGKPAGHTPEQTLKRQGSDSASREPDSAFGGSKLYVERARKAFPILVRQAKAGEKLYYSDLAGELEMPNPRNLNYVLGHIGREIQKLAKRWRTEIPPIQCLVVNKSTGLPGEGIGWFISRLEDFKKRSPQERRQILEIELVKVFNYRQWDEVLSAFGLEALQPQPAIATLKSKAARYGGVGETEDHRRLKEYIARTPKILGLSGCGQGTTEFVFPSADRIDVLFQQGQEWVGVEVKGATSDDGDLVRGLFQCVKYVALLEANLKSDLKKGSIRVVLVSARKLPAPVRELKSILGVEVLDGITVPT